MDISLESIGALIGTVGFPSLIAIILLRTILGNFNQKIDKLDKRLVQLNKSIVLVVKTLNQLKKIEHNSFTNSHISNTSKGNDNEQI